MIAFDNVLERALSGNRLSADDALTLLEGADLSALMAIAGELRDSVHAPVISYSRKVFIPLTQLCRDSCHYCGARPRNDAVLPGRRSGRSSRADRLAAASQCRRHAR